MDLIIQAGVQNKYAALFSASTSKRVNELRHKFRKLSLTSAQINFGTHQLHVIILHIAVVNNPMELGAEVTSMRKLLPYPSFSCRISIAPLPSNINNRHIKTTRLNPLGEFAHFHSILNV